MTHTPMRACEWCGKRQVRTFGTDGNGRVIEHPLPCGCAELVEARRCVRCRRPSGPYVGTCNRCRQKIARRRAAIARGCVDCGGPPRSVRAKRCRLCHRRHTQEQQRIHSLAHYHRTKAR